MFVANIFPKILNSRSIFRVSVKILFMSLFCFGSHFDMFITEITAFLLNAQKKNLNLQKKENGKLPCQQNANMRLKIFFSLFLFCTI